MKTLTNAVMHLTDFGHCRIVTLCFGAEDDPQRLRFMLPLHLGEDTMESVGKRIAGLSLSILNQKEPDDADAKT